MPGPQPRYWGPFASLVWIVTRDEAFTSTVSEQERRHRPPLHDLQSFLAMRNRELDEPAWLELDAEDGNGSVQLALWRFIDPSMQGPAKDIETAPHSLLQELRDGSRLRATGHADLADQRIDVPVHFWRGAGAYLPDPSGDVHIAFADRRTVWTDVLLRMHDVKRCWQPLGRGERIARRPSDAAVTDWYKERVANWPANRAPPSIRDDWTEAKNDWDASSTEPSRDQIEAVRRQLAPPEWKRRGRRPLKMRKSPES